MKVVRTAFFVNAVVALIAAGAFLAFFIQEIKLHNLRAQISEWTDQIESNRIPSAAAVRKFKEFQAQEKQLKEAVDFMATDLKASEFLWQLGVILPRDIIIDTIDWRGEIITMRGTVTGAPDEASGFASAFVELLEEDEMFGPLFGSVALTNLAKNPTTGLLAIEIQMTFKEEE